MEQILHAVTWWLGAEVLALAAVPYAFLLFHRLPDRGYSLSKALGFLVFGYLIWLIGSFGLLPNSRGLAVFVLFLLVTASLFVASRHKEQLAAFLKGNLRYVLFVEALFVVSYTTWVVVRAYSPQIQGTEKPMDFAFMNSILQSESFPPHDPWLSGLSISYYYFGYLIAGSMTALTNVPSAIAYNLAVALLFSLTVLGAYGISYNLAESASWGMRRIIRIPAPYVIGLTGVLFTIGLGNLEGILEMLRAHGFGSGAFWSWVGIDGLKEPYNSAHWYPTDNWWWWRATRVIGTIVDGRNVDYTITEFPFFSFLLGDLHPHVMTLPSVFLALALSLNLLLSGETPGFSVFKKRPFHLLGIALCLGGLGFMNSWDYPTYVSLFLGAGVLCLLRTEGRLSVKGLMDLAIWASGIVALSLLLYTPFYWNTGLGLLAVLSPGGEDGNAFPGLPVALWRGPTSRPFHLLLIWGPFFFLTGSYILCRTAERHRTTAIAAGVVFASLLVLLGVIEWGLFSNPERGKALVLAVVQRGWLLLPLCAIGAGVLSRAKERAGAESASDGPQWAPAAFVGILIAFALLLLLTCEAVFLRDVFDNRMNTVFKLYYQAWALLAVASTFALYYISWAWSRSAARWVLGRISWSAAAGLLLAGMAVYPVASIVDRTDGGRNPPTLNGLDFISRGDPHEAEALGWLMRNVRGDAVVLEATGGEYSEFGRVSSRTGLPTVIGWYGHEVQWRGSDREFKDRPKDVDAVYSTLDKGQIAPILAKYGVLYIYVGALERRKYPKEALDAFPQYMDVAFKNDGVIVYRVMSSG